MAEQDDEPKASLPLRVGQVIAKTGVVLGAVALGVAAIGAMGAWGNAPGVDAATGEEIAGKGIAGAIDKAPEWVKNTVSSLNLTSPGNVALTGAVVGGGSYLAGAFVNKLAERSIERQEMAQLERIKAGGYAANEQARSIEGIMEARLFVTNPEYFAEAMRSRGRGA